MDVADPDPRVEGEKLGQRVDGSSVPQVADHGHGLARHGTELAADGEHIQQGLKGKN